MVLTFSSILSHLYSVQHQADSFEGFIFRRFSQWWNSSVDNVHGRLLGLPDTVDGIVQDAKSGKESPPVSK